MTHTPDRECQEFRRALGGGLDLDPSRQAAIDSHAAVCAECEKFRALLTAVDRLGEIGGRLRLKPAEETRERLHASWQHLAVRSTWNDWVKYWFCYEIEPKIMRPLMPHAAMIFGFIFFSLSLIQIQLNTGWMTSRPVADRQFYIAERINPSKAKDLGKILAVREEFWGKFRIDTA